MNAQLDEYHLLTPIKTIMACSHGEKNSTVYLPQQTIQLKELLLTVHHVANFNILAWLLVVVLSYFNFYQRVGRLSM